MQRISDRKPIVVPKTWNPRDVYGQYAEKLLATHPEYWSKYSKSRKMRHFWIYTIIANKVVEVINFDRWKQVVSAYFMSARAHIINGDSLQLTDYLGRIEAKRVERNHNNPKINFGATAKRPKVLGTDGVLRPDVLIYYTEDDWVRVGWVKTKHLANETAYKFTPCSGDKDSDGFKQQFSKANMANPSLKFNYKYYPYIRQHKLKPGS